MSENTDKIRLDQALVERGLFASRSRARDAVARGTVRVNGQVVTKAGQTVTAQAELAVDDPASRFVSRAALKLTAALDHFGFEVDLADNASIGRAIAQITVKYDTIDLLINNGAMWLEASDEPHSEQEVFGTINAAVTGSFLFTQGLLPLLKRSARPDIVTIGSISALPNAPLHSVAVPFYAAKHAQAAIATGLQQMLRGTPVRSLCVHPPYLDDISPADTEWDAIPERVKGERATNRDVCEAVMFAITRPRHITLSSITIDTDEGGLFG